MRPISMQQIISWAAQLKASTDVFGIIEEEPQRFEGFPERYAAPSETIYSLMIDWLAEHDWINEDERELAMLPFVEVPPDDRAERALILDTCRLLFTEWLHQAIEGRPLDIHWTTEADKAAGEIPHFKQ